MSDSLQVVVKQTIEAKLESDRARREAIAALDSAERSNRRAERNYRLAEERRKEADQERQNVIEQMKLTADANNEAARLYYVALCNTLAMKAKNQYEDKSLNLRLAKTACEMNRKGGADTKNADLYDAMLYAMEQNKMIRPHSIDGGIAKSMSVATDGTINTFDENGSIKKYSASSDGSISITKQLTDFESKVPMDNAVFATPSIIACSAKDRKSYLIDLDKNRRTKLPIDDDYVISASASPDNKKCAVAYTYGKVIVLPSDGSPVPTAEKNFGAMITDIYHDGNNVYVLTHDGGLLKWTP
ncbi:MAG: hypothetical protein II956_16310 [Bacteroidales bacterium]|nr:hypothetical protein [Bacteroidales bacterium]